MKTKIALLLAVFIPFAARSADAPSAALQMGLFEEEASQNLAAAIAAYQSVLTAHAEERKLAATALFRLGECHRKLGQTNDAIAQYQRLIRDFADQTTLATLSQQNLTGLGAETKRPSKKGMMGLTVPELMQLYAAQNPPGSTVDPFAANTPPPNFPPAVRAQLKELLQGEIAIAEQLLAEQRNKAKAGVVSPGDVDRFARDVLGLRRQLLAVDGLVAAEDRKQWRELLLEEIVLAERAVQVERSKLDSGLSAPSELAKLQRDVLALKRELVMFDAVPASRASARPSLPSPATSAALEELQRTEQMLARINGWDISQLRKLLPTVVPDADLETLNAALMQAEQSLLSADDDTTRKLLSERVEQLRRRTEIRIVDIRNLLHERVESLRKSVAERQ